MKQGCLLDEWKAKDPLQPRKAALGAGKAIGSRRVLRLALAVSAPRRRRPSLPARRRALPSPHGPCRKGEGFPCARRAGDASAAPLSNRAHHASRTGRPLLHSVLRASAGSRSFRGCPGQGQGRRGMISPHSRCPSRTRGARRSDSRARIRSVRVFVSCITPAAHD